MTDLPRMTAAAVDALKERERQITEEAMYPELDDATRGDGQLIRMAMAYSKGDAFYWPASVSMTWFKPTNKRRDLIKAIALLLAEVERMDRVGH